MSLGGHLSNKDKKSLFLPNGVVIGTVIRAFVTVTNPPKEKRFIVVGFHENKIDLASVLINTDINPTFNYNSELVLHHLLFESQNREYLDYDSYVDCSDIKHLNREEINRKINKNPSIVIGHVQKQDMDKIMLQILHSRIIKGKVKRRCGIFDYEFDE